MAKAKKHTVQVAADDAQRPLGEVTPAVAPEVVPIPKKSPARVIAWCKAHKKVAVPSALFGVLLIITAIPQSRYVLPGLFIKKNVSFIVQDKSALTRISDADVQVDGKLFASDQNGVVRAEGVRPGSHVVTVNKLFYKTYKQTYTVSLFSNKQQMLNIESTGRPAKVTVKNRLNGKVLAGISVKTEQGSNAKTDSNGKATLILPSDKSEVKGTMSGDGIVTADVTIRAVQDDSTNVYRATPEGRVYFLSKASGKVDVVKTNLDGTDRQVVLAATGKESEGDTVLLASKDWKYLALKSRRDSELPKLYLIETTSGKLTTIDEGNASFSLIGWSGNAFVYTVDRNGLQLWSTKRQALKSFNAATKQLATLDETRGEGTSNYDYAYEVIQAPYLLGSQITYTKTWYASYYYGTHLADKKMSITVVKPDGSGKKTLHEWQAGYYTYMSTVFVGPEELYYQVTLDGGERSTWEYSNGAVTENKELTQDDFNKAYPAFLESPNGKNTLWSEARDGKNTLFIGDAAGKNGKEIATLSEYVPYGWFTDEYVLVSKNFSELYVLGRDGIKPGSVPTKVSDYHRPNYSFYGYGKGYGGL